MAVLDSKPRCLGFMGLGFRGEISHLLYLVEYRRYLDGGDARLQ